MARKQYIQLRLKFIQNSNLQRLAISPEQKQENQILLTLEQQHYLLRVLRLRSGDRFVALDGQGNCWLAALGTASEAGFLADCLEVLHLQTELPLSVTLAIALPKGSGFDEIVRQATELGVTCLAPLISERTLLNPSAQKLERWQRIAREAAEQSERQIVPTILEPLQFQPFLATHQATTRYLCVTRLEAPPLLQQISSQPPASLIIATGPEGGWTEAEVEQAIAAGYQPVSLGRRILRTVTAPIAALAIVTGVCELHRNP